MRILPLALLIVAISCSDSTTAPTFASVAGTWSLQTINGTPLPFTTSQSATDRTEILSDIVNATSSGTFTETTTFRITQNGSVSTQSTVDNGTFSLNGTAVTFTFNSDGSTDTGSLNGNTMTVTETGFALVFTKQ
jgi:hypothetical protein